MVDQATFISFLMAAKRATYAAQSGSARVDAVVTGSTQLEYARGDWLYRDIYYGEAFFAGQEVVFWKSLPVWSMCYAGGLNDPENAKEIELKVYSFLKKALQSVPVEMPYRGPAEFISEDLVYRNQCRGRLERFEGREEVIVVNRTVYELGYVGGLLVSLDEIKSNP